MLRECFSRCTVCNESDSLLSDPRFLGIECRWAAFWNSMDLRFLAVLSIRSGPDLRMGISFREGIVTVETLW